MRETRFTGERLHEGLELFSVDLARHRAAYEFARERLGTARILDLGCGGGSGASRLAAAGARVLGIDRVPPDQASRGAGADFCCADLSRLPVRARSFDAVVSFQVIEHFADPIPFVRAIAATLAEAGTALVSTPNRALSDGVNPYHAHEYLSQELHDLLAAHFAEVEVLGVGMSDAVRTYMTARSRRIRRIVRLDPLRLRERLPRALIAALFAWGARIVRRETARADGIPNATWRDFPIERAGDATSIDWLAVCRRPRASPRDA